MKYWAKTCVAPPVWYLVYQFVDFDPASGERVTRKWFNKRWIRVRGERLYRYIGIERAPVGHIERGVSTIGGVVAIYVLMWLERGLLGDAGAAMLVASMGASAVLLFAVPHGALSQPWPVIGGHVISAIVGVTCARYVADPMLAAALAVGLSIGAMHYLRAIHPPGGATALTAVIGGQQVAALGYGFVVHPVLVNASIMVVAAIAINASFNWRRYPAAWGRPKSAEFSSAPDALTLTHSDFTEALRRIGTFVDITEDEFMRLRELMREAADRRHLATDDIKLGRSYSNGAVGSHWGVRMIVDEEKGKPDGTVIWRAVAGRDRNQTGLSTRGDFAAWAAYEVVRSESTWHRPASVAGRT